MADVLSFNSSTSCASEFTPCASEETRWVIKSNCWSRSARQYLFLEKENGTVEPRGKALDEKPSDPQKSKITSQDE